MVVEEDRKGEKRKFEPHDKDSDSIRRYSLKAGYVHLDFWLKNLIHCFDEGKNEFRGTEFDSVGYDNVRLPSIKYREDGY